MDKPFLKYDFPRAILHVDGDGFFAGCEVAKDPSLRGKPVVVGRERGMALAMTYEAKARGVRRGMTLTEARRVCPDAIFLDADHESYELFSHRMNNIIERHSPSVERYSVDESFADLTGMRSAHKTSYPEIAMELKETLHRELGMTFSIGIAPTKVLAKIASKWRKPDGLTIVPGRRIEEFLAQHPIEDVWGIGRQTDAYMKKLGIVRTLDFAMKPKEWVEARFAKPYQDIWHELRGESRIPLAFGARKPYASLMRTRTFTPRANDPDHLLAELSRHIEVVCARAREHGLSGKTLSFFLKTQSFRYEGATLKLSRATHVPDELLGLVRERFADLYRKNVPYRACGATLSDLSPVRGVQLDLFDTTLRIERWERIYEEVDGLNVRFGRPIVHLASSVRLLERARARGAGGKEDDYARLGIPFIGEVA